MAGPMDLPLMNEGPPNQEHMNTGGPAAAAPGPAGVHIAPPPATRSYRADDSGVCGIRHQNFICMECFFKRWGEAPERRAQRIESEVRYMELTRPILVENGTSRPVRPAAGFGRPELV